MVSKSRVFVFGSNLSGVHGAGAARYAWKNKGAIMGFGEGHCGESYALPTKDTKINTLPLEKVKHYVDRFLDYANQNPDLEFEVTRIGCGLAGFTDEEIAPLFRNAPKNVILPTPLYDKLCPKAWRLMNGEPLS